MDYATLTSDQLTSYIDQHLLTSAGRLNTKLVNKTEPLLARIHQLTVCLDDSFSLPARINFIRLNLTAAPVCVACGDATKYNKQTHQFNDHCSAKCRFHDDAITQKRHATCVARYGNQHYVSSDIGKQTQAATNNKKYGVDKPFQSNTIQQQVRQTIESKYGVRSTSQLPDIAAKQAATNNKKYGVDKPFQSKQIQNAVTKTHQLRFAQSRHSKSLLCPIALDFLQDRDWLYNQHTVLRKPLTQIAAELNVSDGTVGNYLRGHGMLTKHFFTSSGENEVASFVETLTPNVERNTRTTISPHELDIYLPEHKLAIEYCGLYWHSDKFKSRNYHRDKMKSCQDIGVRLLTIFEDEWLNKTDLVERKIANILGTANDTVYARKCQVVSVDNKNRKQFMNTHHIQGDGPGSITYGLAFNDQLVAVMTFRKRSALNDNHLTEYELNRFATSCTVPGGFTKLVKHFQRNIAWDRLISFADARWSEGRLYQQTGWEFDGNVPPDYSWCKGDNRFHKFAFRHNNLHNKIPNYDPALSENDNCKNNGFVKVFNCGLYRYILNK